MRESKERGTDNVEFVRTMRGKSGTAELALPKPVEFSVRLEFTATKVGFVAMAPAERAAPSAIDLEPPERLADWRTSFGWTAPTAPLLRPMRMLPPSVIEPDVL